MLKREKIFKLLKIKINKYCLKNKLKNKLKNLKLNKKKIYFRNSRIPYKKPTLNSKKKIRLSRDIRFLIARKKIEKNPNKRLKLQLKIEKKYKKIWPDRDFIYMRGRFFIKNSKLFLKKNMYKLKLSLRKVKKFIYLCKYELLRNKKFSFKFKNLLFKYKKICKTLLARIIFIKKKILINYRFTKNIRKNNKLKYLKKKKNKLKYLKKKKNKLFIKLKKKNLLLKLIQHKTEKFKTNKKIINFARPKSEKFLLNSKFKKKSLSNKKNFKSLNFYVNFMLFLKSADIYYDLCLLKIIKNRLNFVKKIKSKKFSFRIKKHRKLLLLNIFFKKKKILKPTVNEVKNIENFKMRIRFFIFFIKKIILNKNDSNFILYFKIKKFTKESKIWKKLKRFFLLFKFFKAVKKFVKICNKILCINLNLKPLYNKTHAHRNLKNKKIRRRKKKKKR